MKTGRDRMEEEWSRFEKAVVKLSVAETVPSMARMAFVVGYNVALLGLCENDDATAQGDLISVDPAFVEEGDKWAARLMARAMSPGPKGGAS